MERYLYRINLKKLTALEILFLKKKVFFFYQPAELFPSFNQLREEKEHILQ